MHLLFRLLSSKGARSFCSGKLGSSLNQSGNDMPPVSMVEEAVVGLGS